MEYFGDSYYPSFAAGVVYHANTYQNHIVTWFPSNLGNWRIWSLLKIPYWQVYGELYLDTLEGIYYPYRALFSYVLRYIPYRALLRYI